MKRYGMNPQDLVLVVNYEAYNDLLQDPGFADITAVGSELAIKLTGTIGSIFGIPIVVTEQTDSTRGLPGGKTGTIYTAVLVNHRNYVIPRLKGVSIETEYQVANQRNALVASQSLGFHELVAGNTAGGEPAVLFRYT